MKQSSPYYRQRFLCSAGEFRFYQALVDAVGDRFTVMLKVRAAALLRCNDAEWERWGRRVSQKEFDFVLVERGSSFVAAAVELDDKTHDLEERRERDQFLDEACNRAGLPLVRFRVVRDYERAALRGTVFRALLDARSNNKERQHGNQEKDQGRARRARPSAGRAARVRHVRRRARRARQGR